MSSTTQIIFLLIAGSCIMTIIIFLLYLIVACIGGLWMKHKTPVKRMHVQGDDLVEVEEVV